MHNLGLTVLLTAALTGLSVAPVAHAQAESPAMTKPNAAQDKVWADILTNYGIAGDDLNRFDYGGLSESADDMAALAEYIDALAAMTPSAMGREEALSYWANLYNALTVQVVAQNWPVKSIRKIKSGLFSVGPWDKELVTVEGRKMSLNNIEHDTMRATYDEPRIHYMVNCASIGCPNLMLKPWTAETFEADADAAARDFVNSPRGAEVKDGKVTVSSIYKWYSEDFGDTDGDILLHLKQYADEGLSEKLSAYMRANTLVRISGYQYDWDVNAK